VIPLLESRAGLVVGSRHRPGAEIVRPQPTGRRLGGTLFRAVAGQLLPGITDTQCGFKFLQAPVARELMSRCTTDGFAFDLELLMLARASEITIHEVPVVWTDREGSTLRPIRDGVRSLGDAMRLARSRTPLARRTRNVAT
jgi:dolichyl-phosphate beta-glucosyltransferase